MTVFELYQTDKIIIHDAVLMDEKHFVNMILNNHKDNAIWCNGLMLYLVAHPTTDAMVENMRDGNEEHILAVYFARKEEYTDTVKSENGMQITLTFAASVYIHDLAKWLQGAGYV